MFEGSFRQRDIAASVSMKEDEEPLVTGFRSGADYDWGKKDDSQTVVFYFAPVIYRWCYEVFIEFFCVILNEDVDCLVGTSYTYSK